MTTIITTNPAPALLVITLVVGILFGMLIMHIYYSKSIQNLVDKQVALEQVKKLSQWKSTTLNSTKKDK